MADPIISLRKVSYSYPHAPSGRVSALAGIDLEINEGEFVGLVGANGSGKSTLAKLLNGLIIPTEGEVLVDGKSTAKRENLCHIRKKVGLVFQNPESQIVATTVEDDIAFGLENLGLPLEEIERRVQEVAGRFGLSDLLGREPHWLSGGQKQRTVLAGVVAIRPLVLVLDEPTSMLDPRSARHFHALVRELWKQGTTVVYITHLMDEVFTATRIIALADGHVEFNGSPRDFFSQGELLKKNNLVPPLPVRLSVALTSKGHEVPLALTMSELVEGVCAWS